CASFYILLYLSLVPHQDLHSFPTRRSSDLDHRRRCGPDPGDDTVRQVRQPRGLDADRRHLAAQSVRDPVRGPADPASTGTDDPAGPAEPTATARRVSRHPRSDEFGRSGTPGAADSCPGVTRTITGG